jgi:hypothetical protein
MRVAIRFLPTILLFLLLTSNANAQEPLKHEKRIYRAADGKLYINKSLPMYLKIGTNSDTTANTHLLRSEISKQYTNPFYFDTDGKNTIHTPSCVDTVTKIPLSPQREIIFEVYADSHSPESSISYGNVPKMLINGTQFYGKNCIISLTAKDLVSGVEKIVYSIDKEPYKPYSSSIQANQEKPYFFQYYSVDNVGNAEAIQARNFTVDLTSPVTTHQIIGDQKDNIISKRTTITLKSTDSGSGVLNILYSIDDSKKSIYKGPINVNYLSEGEHTLTYYSVDKVSNQEEPVKFVFFLDNTPPVVVEEVLGDQFYINGKAYSSGRTKLKITAVDNKAGVQAIYYSIGNEPRQLYDKPFYLPNKSGSTIVRSFANDFVNNMSGGTVQSSRTHATYIDLTGPSLVHSYTGPTFIMRDTVYINSTSKIKLIGKDSESGFKKITFSCDKEPEVDFADFVANNKEGFHEISYTGYDNVNNTNLSRLFFITDVTGPIIYTTFSILPFTKKKTDSGEIDVYAGHVVLFLAAQDAKVGYDKLYYSINGAREILYTTMISGFKSGQNYNLVVRALDKLGNQTKTELKFAVQN